MQEQEQLGAAVRGAREAAGLTLEQVSARTRIRPALLRELEVGSAARCGGSTYARGHLRAIATVTGADPAALLSALAAVERAEAPEQAEPLRSRAVLPPAAREGRRPRWGAAAGLAVAAVAVLLLVGALRGGPAAPPVTALPAPRVVSAPPAPPAPVAAPPAAASLRLQVGSGRSWVTVRASSGRSLFQGVLDAGTQREFTDPGRLTLTLGNASVVTVGCGSSSAAGGSSQKVRRFVCAPDGLAPA